MKEKAIAAYGVLDYISRDLVAASEAFRHFQSPEIRTSLSQHSPAYLNRLCLNHIFIALSRWQEFYKKFFNKKYLKKHGLKKHPQQDELFPPGKSSKPF